MQNLPASGKETIMFCWLSIKYWVDSTSFAIWDGVDMPWLYLKACDSGLNLFFKRFECRRIPRKIKQNSKTSVSSLTLDFVLRFYWITLPEQNERRQAVNNMLQPLACAPTSHRAAASVRLNETCSIVSHTPIPTQCFGSHSNGEESKQFYIPCILQAIHSQGERWGRRRDRDRQPTSYYPWKSGTVFHLPALYRRKYLGLI